MRSSLRTWPEGATDRKEYGNGYSAHSSLVELQIQVSPLIRLSLVRCGIARAAVTPASGSFRTRDSGYLRPANR